MTLMWITFNLKLKFKFKLRVCTGRFLEDVNLASPIHENGHVNATYISSAAFTNVTDPDAIAALAEYIPDGPFNPQRLIALRYMTPMASLVPGIPHRCVLTLELKVENRIMNLNYCRSNITVNAHCPAGSDCFFTMMRQLQRDGHLMFTS